jgi:hypothetical protein
MNRIILLVLGLSILLLVSCSNRDEVNTGTIHLYNQTNYTLWYQINQGDTRNLESYGVKDISFDMPNSIIGVTSKPISIKYGYGARIIDEETVEITAGKTFNYTLLQPHGKLHLFNNSNHDIESYAEYASDGYYCFHSVLSPHSDQVFNVIVRGSLEGGTSTQITVWNRGNYYLAHTSLQTIACDSTITVDINATAGTFEIKNVSDSLIITQVYLSRNSGQDWGESVFGYYLNPGSSQLSSQLPGNYDIKLYDNEDNIYILHDQVITLDENTLVTFTGRKSPFLNIGKVDHYKVVTK